MKNNFDTNGKNRVLTLIISLVLIVSMFSVLLSFTSCKKDDETKVDVDTNDDGNPDINLDVDNDGKPDVNIDTDGDKKPDVNVDTDGDLIPDYNLNEDGIELPIIPI